MIFHWRKRGGDFKEPDSNQEVYYDVNFDADLIEASLAAQYNVRMRRPEEADITYAEWARLVSGLMDDTPLGRVVQLRMEKDPKVIKKYGAFEKKVRADWAAFKRKNLPVSADPKALEALQAMLKRMFSN